MIPSSPLRSPGLRLLFTLLLLLAPLPPVQATDTRDIRLVSPELSSEARVALVIGNGAYASGPLRTPASDARLVAARLGELGFSVTLVIDADRDRMRKAIIDFGGALKAGGTGLFYYAGHAVQARDRNYLVPIDAQLTDETYIRVQAVDVEEVSTEMEAAGNRLNILILDACRRNPYTSASRSAAEGLAMLSGPTGTFMAYSTSANRSTEDGPGVNSVFATSLVRAMGRFGADLNQVFDEVRTEVYETTRQAQLPETRSMVVGPGFVFNPKSPEPNPEAPPQEHPPAEARSAIEWVSIPEGTFEMGSSSGEEDERPVHAVQMRPFEISRTEVTIRQYKACVDAGICEAPAKCDWGRPNWGVAGREDHPVNCVSWGQARTFASWVGGRLPSEAEWEYAARGGQGYVYAGSAAPADVAWGGEARDAGTHPVALKKANGYGLFDMSGNVQEWVQDPYHASYVAAPTNGSAWEAPLSGKVLRGGSWSESGAWLSLTNRDNLAPGQRSHRVGFRVARSAPGAALPGQ